MIVNDRPDLARLGRADGVHLGQEDLSVKDARAIVGPEALIGVSTHRIEQARQAVLDGANYIGVGPTFPSGTKQFESSPALDFLRAVAAEIRLPAFAIGGITPGNLAEVLAAGIGRVPSAARSPLLPIRPPWRERCRRGCADENVIGGARSARRGAGGEGRGQARLRLQIVWCSPFSEGGSIHGSFTGGNGVF